MDAMDAILYQHAAQARDIWLDTLSAAGDMPEHRFSRGFERKMARLIRQERRSPRMKQTVHILKRTAAAVLVLLSVSFAGLMSVEAYREKVIEVVVKVFHELTEYRFKTDANEVSSVPTVSFSYIPNGMTQTVYDTYDGTRSFIVYENSQGDKFVLSQNLIVAGESNTMILDTEGADSEYCVIRGYDVLCVTKEDRCTLVWSDQNVLYTLIGNIGVEDMKRIAEQLVVIGQ